MIKMTDELDRLIIDEKKELDKGLLVGILEDYIMVVNSGKVIPSSKFFGLNNKLKVIIYLLSRKVMAIKGIVNEEAAGPSTISQETGIPNGSVKTVLHRYGKIFLTAVNGKYKIPNYNINRIKEMVVKNE